MSLKSIDISGSIASAKAHLQTDDSLSQSTRSMLSLLIVIVELFSAKFGANSSNSSVPPSLDPHRPGKKKTPTGRKVGGQPGHRGTTLKQVSEPDEVVEVKVDRSTLPEGRTFSEIQPEKRQVFDIHIKVHVTEYQVQVLKDRVGPLSRGGPLTPRSVLLVLRGSIGF